MAVRLSISNFKTGGVIFLYIIIITVLSICFVEFFYSSKNIPLYIGKNHDLSVSNAKKSKKPTLFILGDSRAESGIIPELIDEKLNLDSYNIGISGVYNGYYNKLTNNGFYPNNVIIAVSPYSIFNDFKLKKKNIIKDKTQLLRKPNQHTEKFLSRLVNENSRLHYGAQGFFDVLKYNKVSGHYSAKGWHGYDRLGSDEYYTYMINLNAYKHKIIEEYKDPLKISEGKANFKKLLEDLNKNEVNTLFVRIPVSEDIRAIENEKYPWFSKYIKEVTSKYGYKFYDFKKFKYPKKEVDGSHLNKVEAKKFTVQLIDSILKHKL